MFQLLVTIKVVPSKLIIFTLIMEEICSSETLVLTRATQLQIPEDDILQILFKLWLPNLSFSRNYHSLFRTPDEKDTSRSPYIFFIIYSSLPSTNFPNIYAIYNLQSVKLGLRVTLHFYKVVHPSDSDAKFASQSFLLG
jgi:hypothetical protein